MDGFQRWAHMLIRLYSYTVFYQQHDATVAALLSALQVYDDIRPKYASTVFVELYSDSNRLYVYPCTYICMYICVGPIGMCKEF